MDIYVFELYKCAPSSPLDMSQSSPATKRPNRDKQRHVALIIETSKVYGREILLGISHYHKIHGPWSVFTRERS